MTQRVFVYEYTCAVPGSPGAEPLRAEGTAMLEAVLEDFTSVPHVVVSTLCDARDEETEFRRSARSADCAFVIAPETNGILAQRAAWAVEEHCPLLGPPPEVIEHCADKLALARTWQKAGVLTPDTQQWTGAAPAGRKNVIIKPRDGAGCEATYTTLLGPGGNREHAAQASDSLPHLLARRAHGQSERDDLIVQPRIAGLAASVAFLIGPSCSLPLLPCAQRIEPIGNRLEYRGGSAPLQPVLADRAVRIATQAIDAVPGLFGYVGVDVVLGDDGRDWAIEINPRMTTSYIGLRRLFRGNLMEALLQVVAGRLPELVWSNHRVAFTADGQVTVS